MSPLGYRTVFTPTEVEFHFDDGEVITQRRDPWVEAFHAQRGRCFYCACPIARCPQQCGMPRASAGQVEHMVPRARGGSDDWSNKVLSCVRCNVKKGILTREEFLVVRSLEAAARAIRDRANAAVRP